MVSKSERDAYERGKSDREFAMDHPVGALIGGVGTSPSDPAEREAYDKGLSGKQLDGDKKK